MTGVASIMAGYGNSFFVKIDGSLWVTGYNDFGQLGTGNTSNRSTPAQIMTDVATVETGDAHSLFLKTNGSVWAAGNNLYGEFGNGNSTSSSTPVQVMTSVAAIAAGEGHSLFLKPDGSVLTAVAVPNPLMVGSYSAIAAGNGFSLGLRINGSVMSTGNHLFNFQTIVPNEITLAATSSSGLPITYNIISGPATCSGSVLTLTGQGTVTVTASQAGNATYSAATPVTMSFNSAKGSQSITFPPLPDKVEGDAPFSVNASTSSGLAPIFSIVSGPATITGRLITLTGPGTITVRVSQPGDTRYAAAASVEQSFSTGGINLLSSSVVENNTSGSFIGSLSVVGAEESVIFTYSLEPGVGSEDNGFFSISGGYFYMDVIADYETKSTYRIRLRATGSTGLYFEKAVTISVIDADESGAWVFAGSLAVARREHTATKLSNGRVLVVGGRGSSQGAGFNSCEIYNPTTETWTPAQPMNSARFAHTATLLPDGRVFVCGGQISGNIGTASAEIYDPTNDTWSVVAPLGYARFSHAATLLPNGKLLISGGRSSSFTPVANLELYDFANSSWSNPVNLITPRAQHTASLLPNGKVLITGGLSSAIGSDVSASELYDPATGSQTATAPLTGSRTRHTATVLSDGRLLVAAGSRVNAPQNSAELYEANTGTWSPAGNLLLATYSHACALLPDGSVWSTGGLDSSTGISLTQRYSPTSSAWKPYANLNSKRGLHTITLLANGKLLVVGGSSDRFNALNTSETYSLNGTGSGSPIVVFNSSTSTAGLTGDDALPTATPFNDGVENLLKYAFNMNLAGPDVSKLPLGTGTSGLPSISTPDAAPPGTLRFEFLRRKGSGLVYAPQKSTTLDGPSWSPLTALPVVTSINDQWERVVYTEAPDPVPAPTCFGRVSVSLP